ncbi:uncharacterized protein LOC127732062 isoform X5 [Mytilus californianus]|uniref:uncharacterized protein LOC127732062 isoform X1 n=1 Tax=Mytilus californianus TaxID=6549 RepID=UPI0022478AD6|nr:uncharacterized protein LOC127732062 isoform X1 [Mytilus californianus]XP_052097075.1 uncharacterized protein LOC127732062 isoform X2 [Mytilus californianus]XP_052097077.1 uncharacterized protein LOC127732062 isoform X3 [Mytilus californianus]XP_052097078.1 uncharacterized protein LOC127732062 isoform X4 [Mytilus californianus]XP_052097079.1 uncharacterized protein LOC127732062 isoform X5 [Mytilus californianus]
MTSLLKFVAYHSRLIIGILALSTMCNCDKDFNLTFYNESKTWSEAKDFCFMNGGILETDQIIIRNYTKEHVKIWLGAYSMITPWAGVFGCYFWNVDDRNDSIEFDLQNKEECQIRCPQSHYEFFVFKEKTCYCFNSDKLPKDDISQKKWSNSETDYVFIYRQNIEPDRDASDTNNCMTVECKDRDRILTPENCNSTYKALCENLKRRSTTSINFYNATKFCENEDSFVRWDPSISCNNSEEKFDQKHWTSITRSQQMFRLTAYDGNKKLKPLQCKGSETSEGLDMFVEPSFVDCAELRSFYCRFGSPNVSPGNNVTMDLPDTDSITSYMITGVIIGIIPSIIAVGVVICVVIVVRRRRSAKRKSDLKKDAHKPNATEEIGHVNNQNRYSYSEIKMEDINQNDNMDSGDEYTTGPSGVYDHLNENKDRKIKTENPHAIYDHSIGDNTEPDYDSTKHIVPANPDYQEIRLRSEGENHTEKL